MMLFPVELLLMLKESIYLKLLQKNKIKKTKQNTDILEHLYLINAVHKIADTYILYNKKHIIEYLNKFFPVWLDILTIFPERGLEIDEKNLHQWINNGNIEISNPLLHKKVYASLKGKSSKTKNVISHDIYLTDDYCIRIRPNKDFTVNGVIWNKFGNSEFIVSERDILNGIEFDMLPDKIISIENLGPYIDIDKPDNCMLIYVPGSDTKGIKKIISLLPDIPYTHFGDLDPMGMEIGYRLTKKPYIPEFYKDYLKYAKPKKWDKTYKQIEDLVVAGLWIEQEVFILDKRIQELFA